MKRNKGSIKKRNETKIKCFFLLSKVSFHFLYILPSNKAITFIVTKNTDFQFWAAIIIEYLLCHVLQFSNMCCQFNKSYH